MRANRKKLELALARACMTPGELASAAKMPRPTVNNVLPATLGRVARALTVDVLEIAEVKE